MPDYPRDSLKRFDVVLLEATIGRYRTGPREVSSTGNLWQLPFDKCNWSTKLTLESICLLVEADEDFNDENFPVAGGQGLPTSPSKARGIEI